MDSRRSFLKKIGMLSAATGLNYIVPDSIQRAMAISADPGTTFYDAEHIVFLMQENRSFDHMFGSLQGVRGFNDPRVFTLPNKNKAWIQSNLTSNYIPFHFDIKETNIMSGIGLAHAWGDQRSAFNEGKHDNWINAKGAKCLGYFNRQDLPFYYDLADAFTVCDHNFCSSLTGTTPNRLFYWAGTNVSENGKTTVVLNEQAYAKYGAFIDCHTFPEILEDNDVSWKVYQNELEVAKPKNEGWTGNYGDNALEHITRYNVKLSPFFRNNGTEAAIAAATKSYDTLTQQQKNLVDKAFTTNINTKDYLETVPFSYVDYSGRTQKDSMPKSDIFAQFRADVDSGRLPTVSWLVAPSKFSDHAGEPFYGTWYVSEALDILTKNPEVWKKTIFILNYDENDGFFDHIPPYVVPSPGDATSGKVSGSIKISQSDYHDGDKSPIGLGFRVPMLIASPWSKGGYVNSQVFDHTSCLMFLENFLSKKTGKSIKSPEISDWRRAICGDLTSAFRPAQTDIKNPVSPLLRDTVMADILKYKSKKSASAPGIFTSAIKKINETPSFAAASPLAKQEKGTRPACAIPYKLFAEAALDESKENLVISLKAGAGNFGGKLVSVGAPFRMYALVNYGAGLVKTSGKTWNYAVAKGGELSDSLKLTDFSDGNYQICVSAPNGFFRQFNGNDKDPDLEVQCLYETAACSGLLKEKETGNIQFLLKNKSSNALAVDIKDNAYQNEENNKTLTIQAGDQILLPMDLRKSLGWYDFGLSIKGHAAYMRQYAGHVETGEEGITDPYMGGLL